MRHRLATAAAAAALLLAGQAGAIVESKTGTEYPDTVSVTTADGEQVLVATGAALREKTMLKVDVYTIASWVASGTELGADRAATIWTLDAPKRLRMDLRRGFSREKLGNSQRIVRRYLAIARVIDAYHTKQFTRRIIKRNEKHIVRMPATLKIAGIEMALYRCDPPV